MSLPVFSSGTLPSFRPRDRGRVSPPEGRHDVTGNGMGSRVSKEGRVSGRKPFVLDLPRETRDPNHLKVSFEGREPRLDFRYLVLNSRLKEWSNRTV